MKLKRLIAIAVVLTTLLSCGCFAGSTVYADDADLDNTIIYHWDGLLIKGNNAWSAADVGVRYGVTGTNGASSADEEGYYEDGAFTKQTGNYRVRRLWPADKVTDSPSGANFIFYKSAYESTGTIATLQDGDNYYYEITYPVFRSNGFTAAVSSQYADFSLADDVYSISYDFSLPADSLTADRSLYYQNVTDAAGTTALVFVTSYDSATGNLDLGASDAYEEVWANDVAVAAGTWYNVETRYALVGSDLLAGVYVNGDQVACYKAADSTAFADGGLKLGNQAVGKISSSGADITTPDSIAYYDDIMYSVLGDKASVAPSAEEPTPGEDPGEDPEDPVVTDAVVYAPAFDGTTLTLTGTISGYTGLAASNYKSIVAVYGTNGRTVKVIPGDVTIGAYTAGSTREVTVIATDDSIASDAKIKVFFFDSLTSFIPVLPNWYIN